MIPQPETGTPPHRSLYDRNPDHVPRPADPARRTLPPARGQVNGRGPAVSVELGLRMTLPLTDSNDHLLDRIEASVHQAGLEVQQVQRRLYGAFIEKSVRGWSSAVVTAKLAPSSRSPSSDLDPTDDHEHLLLCRQEVPPPDEA
jgi:hypothetical protein